MADYRVIVGVDAKTGFLFKLAPADRGFRRKLVMSQLDDAKFIRPRPGDTVSWQVGPMPKNFRKVTGLAVNLFNESPFIGKGLKISSATRTTVPQMVAVSAAGNYFPYEVTLLPSGLKADPGMGVDEPGQCYTEDVALLENGAMRFEAVVEVAPAHMLRFGCQTPEGAPVDFTITFGEMRPEDWPVYPPVDYSTPLASVPGFGVTYYCQVKPVAGRTFGFTAHGDTDFEGGGQISVTLSGARTEARQIG